MVSHLAIGAIQCWSGSFVAVVERLLWSLLIKLSIPLFSFNWLKFSIVIIITCYRLSPYFSKSHFLHMLVIFTPFRYLIKLYHGWSSNKKLYLLWFKKEICEISSLSGKANLQSIQDIVLNRLHKITLPSDSRMKPKFHILYDSYLGQTTHSI